MEFQERNEDYERDVASAFLGTNIERFDNNAFSDLDLPGDGYSERQGASLLPTSQNNSFGWEDDDALAVAFDDANSSHGDFEFSVEGASLASGSNLEMAAWED